MQVEIFIDCVPCMLRQALEAARMATDDQTQQEKIIVQALHILLDYKKYQYSPELAREIQSIIKTETGVKDPYKHIKRKDLQAALDLIPFARNFLESKSNGLYWSLKLAATGNNIDAGIYQNLDVKKCVEEELEKEFYLCDVEELEKKLTTAKTILIIGDNVGESVFDKLFIENLPKVNILYGVRSQPIINDVTEQEAYDSGLGEVAQIISTGCDAPGAILAECSEEFRDVFNGADIIISKGQGNYEALSEERGNIFFLLKAKCPMIARKLKASLNDYVFKYTVNE